jgi:hypothetical protein
MALFRAAPSEAELAAGVDAIKRRLEAKQAQLKAPAANPAQPAEPAQPTDMQMV